MRSIFFFDYIIRLYPDLRLKNMDRYSCAWNTIYPIYYDKIGLPIEVCISLFQPLFVPCIFPSMRVDIMKKRRKEENKHN